MEHVENLKRRVANISGGDSDRISADDLDAIADLVIDRHCRSDRMGRAYWIDSRHMMSSLDCSAFQSDHEKIKTIAPYKPWPELVVELTDLIDEYMEER